MGSLTSLTWFPQQYADVFFGAKAFLAFMATILLIMHMSRIWPALLARSTRGQVMRYVALLAYTMTVAFGSLEQIADNETVAWRHLVSILIAIYVIAAMIISLKEDPKNPSGLHSE